jgi:hypothetical protein
MMKKFCPWCNYQVSLIRLLLLDEHSPRKCKNCGKYLKTSAINSYISVVIPVVLCFFSVYLFNINLLFSSAFLLLIPVLRILLAEPAKYSLNSNINCCLKCNRSNVLFKYPFSTICNNCLSLENKKSGSKISLHQKR